jgi:hypothetical protein
MRKLTDMEIRVLQALRPGMALSPGNMGSLNGNSAQRACGALLELGLVEKRGAGSAVQYRITDLGLAKCPPRNPASLRRNVPPPVQGEQVRGPSGHHASAKTRIVR